MRLKKAPLLSPLGDDRSDTDYMRLKKAPLLSPLGDDRSGTGYMSLKKAPLLSPLGDDRSGTGYMSLKLTIRNQRKAPPGRGGGGNKHSCNSVDSCSKKKITNSKIKIKQNFRSFLTLQIRLFRSFCIVLNTIKHQ